MNTSNPSTSQGSLQEQSKRKSTVRLVFLGILAIHVVVLGAFLVVSCKREDTKDNLNPTRPDEPYKPLVTDTNPPAPPQPPIVTPTNPIVNPLISNPPPVVSNTAPVGLIDPTAPNPAEHVIARGETFATVAKKYGVSVKAVQLANPEVNPTKLKIGQKINIPPKPPVGPAAPTKAGTAEKPASPDVYVVKKGDTLSKIAKNHGVSVKAIRTVNSLKTDQLHVNQKLKLPPHTALATPTTGLPTGAPPPPPSASTPLPPAP